MDKRPKSTEKITKEDLQEQAKIFTRFSYQNLNERRKSQMHQNFLNVRLNKYKSNTFNYKNNICLLFLVLVLFLALLLTSISNIKSKNHKRVFNYCDADYNTFEDNKKDNCDTCPNNAKCEGGTIVECYGNYIIQDQKCIKNEELILLKSKMLEKMEQLLARKKGNYICNEANEEEQYINLEDMESYLRTYFGSSNHFFSSLQDLKMDLEYDDSFNKDIKVKYIDGNTMLYSDNPEFSFYCQTKMYFKENTAVILVFLFVIFLIIFFTLKKIWRKKYILIAEKIYKDILVEFKNKDKIDVRDLIQDPDFVFTKKERDAIFAELENIRIIDEQITYYVVNDIKYWVPL